jgi:tight adherence protein C
MPIVTDIKTMLTDLMGPMGPLIALGGIGLFLILCTLPFVINRKPEPFDRLKQGRDTGRKVEAEMTLRRGNDKGADKLERFAHFLEPQNKEQLSASRLKMMRAGYRSKHAVRIFHAFQFLGGISFLLIGLAYTLLTRDPNAEPDMQATIATTLIPGAIGYYLPTYWLTKRLQTRQELITQGFPDALDMMLVCVEAGQSLDQSIIRVAREARAAYPPLAEEFEIVAHEVKAGKERVQVLRDMSERVGLPDINSFVTTMIQSATFGTSIAEALRVYSSEMRDKRVMRAEEKANTLPTKLTLGTMLFTVPPLLIMLIGPSLYNIAKVGN